MCTGYIISYLSVKVQLQKEKPLYQKKACIQRIRSYRIVGRSRGIGCKLNLWDCLSEQHCRSSTPKDHYLCHFRKLGESGSRHARCQPRTFPPFLSGFRKSPSGLLPVEPSCHSCQFYIRKIGFLCYFLAPTYPCSDSESHQVDLIGRTQITPDILVGGLWKIKFQVFSLYNTRKPTEGDCNRCHNNNNKIVEIIVII